MQDIAAKIEIILNDADNWVEPNPALADIVFRFDEFDPRNPKFQIVLENYPERKTWVSDVLYRIEHRVKITVFLKPVGYGETAIAADKVRFTNAREQIDKILAANKFSLDGVAILEMSQGWNDGDSITVGRDSGFKPTTEPIVFQSVQIVTAIYYSTSFLLPNPYGGFPVPVKYGQAVRYFIVKDETTYYAISDRGDITHNTNCTVLVNSICETIYNSSLMYGQIFFNCDAVLPSSIRYRDGITFIGAMPMGGSEESGYKFQIDYTGTDYAFKEYDEDTWRTIGISNMSIKCSNVSAKGAIRLGKVNFANVDEIMIGGYCSEAAINIPVSSLKGNAKNITNIQIEGEHHIAIGINCQADWCWLKNVTISKTTIGAVRVGDQLYDEPPYECHLENIHGYNCQHRFLDIQWAYYLLAVQCIDEHDANWIGTKESSWYEAPASEGKESKAVVLFNCHAFYDISKGTPPEPYVELIDGQGNLVFMRNDGPSKGESPVGLKVIPKFIVDDNGRGTQDTLQVIGKTTDLLRLSSTIKRIYPLKDGKEVTFALNEDYFQIWNITDAKFLLQISWAGKMTCRDIVPETDAAFDLGDSGHIFNTLHINNIYLHDNGVFCMNGVIIMGFDEEDRLLQNIQINASDCDRGILPDARLSGATTYVTVRDAAGTGTISLYFVNGLFKFTVP